MARVSVGLENLAEVRRYFFFGYNRRATGTMAEEPGRGSAPGTTLERNWLAMLRAPFFFVGAAQIAAIADRRVARDLALLHNFAE